MTDGRVNSWRFQRTFPSVLLHFSPTLKRIGIVGTLAVIAGSLFWGAKVLHEKAAQRQTKLKFQQIALGIRSYWEMVGEISYKRSHPIPSTGLAFEDVPWGTGHLPFPVQRAGEGPSSDWLLRNGKGRSLFSWRVSIMPFLEGLPNALDASQPWDAESNRQLLNGCVLFSYELSDSPNKARKVNGEAFPDANALAITGPGTAFGDVEEGPKLRNEIPPDTILVVESRESGIPWPAPGDFDIRTMPQKINAPEGMGVCSRHAGGFHVIFADGVVWFLSDKVPFETLKQFFTIAGAKNHDREKLLGPYALER